MDLELINKTALVTGSTKGIGHAIARALVREGATVYINGRTPQAVEKAISSLQSETPGAQLHPAAADVGTAEGCDSLIRLVPDVDILINNTGIFEPKAFETIPDADWERFFQVNVMSGVRLTRHYLQGMLARNWGRVQFIASESAIDTPAEMIHYGATKSAQLGVSRGVARLTKGTNVTVNAILPGPTLSEGVRDFVADLARQKGLSVEEAEKEFFIKDRPNSLIQRFATVDEVGAACAYYASPRAAITTGSVVHLHGGILNSIH